MTGERLPDGFHGTAARGAYWKESDGWHCVTPNGRMGSLTLHEVFEHPDRTITVTPSIQVDAIAADGDWKGRPGWHGYLEAGVWREIA